MDATEHPLQLWGGVECTINRVGDRYFSQLERSGHRARLKDLEHFAELGLRTLRFPILWEELAPDSPDAIDWTQIDAQLGLMRELGIKPIAGLVHHGSGPRYTSLLDAQFPEKLASFARKVAERFPWIDLFTPVNEPLTTARFSGLYAHWYPHARDAGVFARALLNQIRGVALSMRAIREVTPTAALVQTEDLGKTYSSSRLNYQVEFENDRRWLTWDLLCGRVDSRHPMYGYLRSLGIDECDISMFGEQPCPPDFIGVNYYVTSERFLDDKLRDHPPEIHGGNGRDRYADVAAVRVRAEGISGVEILLRETCERYALPVVVTEAHLGCTREEQLRWLNEIWGAAKTLRREGKDVHAVTAWSLLGAYNWNSLLTREGDHYEPGAFDLRARTPRPTAVAKMIGEIANGRPFDHPVLETPGWWRRSMRLNDSATQCDECPAPNRFAALNAGSADSARRSILIAGSGRLARHFVRASELRGIPYRLLPEGDVELAEDCWALINCAGFNDADQAEENAAECSSNVLDAEIFAQTCARRGVQFVTFSSDFVFNGAKAESYCESDPVAALNILGRSMIQAEAKVLWASSQALVIRPGKLIAPNEENDPLREELEALGGGERVRVANDIRFSISHVPDLVSAALDLLIDGESGVWHLANSGAVTPEELLITLATHAGVDATLIEGVPFWSLHRPAARPRNRALQSERGQLLPPLQDALRRYIHDSPPVRITEDRLLATS